MDSLRPEAGTQSGTPTDRPTFILLPDLDRERDRDAECPYNCRSPYLCSRCREGARSEALLWLHSLADDHFGYDMHNAMSAGQQSPDLRVLWRDPDGVVRLKDDSARRR
jgi:hypothetical protein